MKIKVSRFRTRPHSPQDPAPQPHMAKATAAAAEKVANDALPFEPEDDGFGDTGFETARGPAGGRDPARTAGPEPADPASLDTIRKEGLTGRQLRMARRLAQKHGLPATSDFDALRLLRKAGIDPFQKSTVLGLVAEQDHEAQVSAGALALSGMVDGVRLPQTVRPSQLPATPVSAEESHIAEVRRIQADILRRRRHKLAMLWARLTGFVLLPTAFAAWYFFAVATPMYTAHSEFVIQQASQTTGALSGLFTGTAFATSQDSIVVQGYLQSPEAMERLDRDRAFRAHFTDPGIDPIQRLASDASRSKTYALFRDYVKISYDPTEGVIKMDVTAADPQRSVEFSRALIGYAEEQVDHLTQRLRDDQMQSARDSFEDAQVKLREVQANLVALQEKYKTLSSEAEASLIGGQIASLEAQVTQEKLSLAQMESNPQPNQARMDPVKRRIQTLQAQIDELRAKLTVGSDGGASVATVQSQLVMAQADVQTRQMMLAQATTALETSRIEANRQTRYLSVAVDPTAPDEPSYPKAFENTLVVMLIFAGIYLMISMTVAILREQVIA